MSLFQSITGIHVKVVEARIMWQTDIKSSWLTFDRWMYLGIVWSGQEQYLTVSIDGKKMPTLVSSSLYIYSFKIRHNLVLRVMVVT